MKSGGYIGDVSPRVLSLSGFWVVCVCSANISGRREVGCMCPLSIARPPVLYSSSKPEAEHTTQISPPPHPRFSSHAAGFLPTFPPLSVGRFLLLFADLDEGGEGGLTPSP